MTRSFLTAMAILSCTAATVTGQVLDETCTVTVNGQTVLVNPDGSFVVPNVSAVDGAPADFLSDDLLRVRGTCIRDGETVFVVSECFRIPLGGTVNIQNLQFTTIPPLTIASIAVSTTATTLTKVGEQTPIIVDGILSDGSAAIIDGTITCAVNYRTSNPDIVAVDQSGIATAVGSGFALVSASTEGLTAVTLLTVSLGDPLTGVTGLVHLADGTGVANVDIELLGLERFTTTLGDGSFMLTDVPTELGDIHAIATTTIGGEEFYGAGRFVEAVGGGFSDAGIIKLTNAIRWVKPADGNWTSVENWEIFSPPGNGQDAVIDVPDAEITVTHDDAGQSDDPIGDLLCNEKLLIEFGSLSVAGAFQMNNTLEMRFGEIVDSTVDLGPSGLINVLTSSTLDGVTINGNMDMVATATVSTRIRSGLTLNGTLRLAGLNTTTGANMLFEGPGKFIDGDAEIAFVSSQSGASIIQNDGGNLHIRSGVSIHGTGGFVGQNAAPLLQEGLIHSDLPGTIHVRGSDWINNGTLRVTGEGSVLDTTGSWINNGAIEASGAGKLILGNAWQNLGTLNVTDSDVRLNHQFTIADLGTFSFVNSLVVIEGTFANDTNLALDAGQFHWRMGGGTVVGGTISSADGTTFDVVPTIRGQNPTLDGVTLDADMRFLENRNVQIRNGLTLNGTMFMNGLDGLGVDAPNRMIDGTGTIAFSTSSASPNEVVQADPVGDDDFGVMTIGPGITIEGGNGRVGHNSAHFGAPASIVNQGTIEANNGRRITVDGTDWINDGLLRSTADGAQMDAVGNWTNNGTVHAEGFFSTFGMWTNNGTVHIDGDDFSANDTWTNNGTVRTGAGFVADSNADYTQSATGTFVTEVTSDASSGYGRMNVVGTASLDGVLRLEFDKAFVPSVGQSFAVVSYGDHVGEFVTIETVGLDPTFQVVPTYNATFLVLAIQLK